MPDVTDFYTLSSTDIGRIGATVNKQLRNLFAVDAATCADA
jgi:hypothetical protein